MRTAVLIFVIIVVNDIFFHRRQRDDDERKLFLNDKNYDENLLTYSSMNKNETKMLGRDDLERDSIRT